MLFLAHIFTWSSFLLVLHFYKSAITNCTLWFAEVLADYQLIDSKYDCWQYPMSTFAVEISVNDEITGKLQNRSFNFKKLLG